MRDNVLIPLPDLKLPADFPWQVKFVSAVDEQLRRLCASGRFLPPRFFGYFFQGENAVGVSGNWTVTLDLGTAIAGLPEVVRRSTLGHFSIVSEAEDRFPDFIFVHDRATKSCWLWRFSYGLQFVECTEAVSGGDEHDSGSAGNSENRKLLGP